MSPEPFDDTPPDMDEAELDRALADDDLALGVQLRTLLDPDTELASRTASDVGRALRSRNTTAAALDLLGVGWWTARALLTDDTRSADRDHEGT